MLQPWFSQLLPGLCTAPSQMLSWAVSSTMLKVCAGILYSCGELQETGRNLEISMYPFHHTVIDMATAGEEDIALKMLALNLLFLGYRISLRPCWKQIGKKKRERVPRLMIVASFLHCTQSTSWPEKPTLLGRTLDYKRQKRNLNRLKEKPSGKERDFALFSMFCFNTTGVGGLP